jgi:hypothetical protein
MKLRGALAVFLAITLLTISPLRAGEATRTLDPLASINVAEAKEKLTYLASKALAGRRAGTDGARLAAEYIADTFKKAGIAPGGKDGTYFQPLKVPPATVPGRDNVLVVKGVNKAFTLVPLEDFVPFAFSPSTEVTAAVVFAGYGMVRDGWNDYAGIDVKGKIVLALRHGPPWKAPQGAPANAKPGPWHGAGREYTFFAKAKAAQERGAVGLILVTDPAGLKGKDRLAFLAGKKGGIRIPCVHAAMVVGEAMLRLVGDSLRERQEAINRTGRPMPAVIPEVRVRLGTSIVQGKNKCANVVGILKGSDPVLSKECVIIGAHYDHLGYGDVGTRGGGAGEIFYGADDNGSGTVGVMEVAEAFGALPFRPRRSIVFVCFAAEEVGLYGSKAYASNPLFPVEKTQAMINMDMIGRGMPNRVGIGGVGTAEIFESLVKEANKELHLVLRIGKGVGGGSDHATFNRKKIPVMTLGTGGNPQYHTPGDTVDKIDFENLTKAAKLVYLMAARLSALEERAIYVSLKRPGRRRGKGVRLGFFPDNWYDGIGALLETISPDTPADRAGLKAGDIILEYDGKKVKSIKELRIMLRQTERGASVKIVYLRDGKTHTVTVSFN